MSPRNALDILGIPVDHVSRFSLPELVETLISQPEMAILAPVNIDIINKTKTDTRLRDFLCRADIVYTDGAGPVLGSWLLGEPLPERVTSIHLLHRLCDKWRDGRYTLYFLGGPPGVAETARDTLCDRYPGVRIVGTWRGHLTTEEQERAALCDIADRRPDVLCVGFGTPVQEHFIDRYRRELRDIPLVWPVGALTTHIAKRVPRAPRWMRKTGFEWAYRLYLEPRRLWRRYIIGNPYFLARVIASRLSTRL